MDDYDLTPGTIRAVLDLLNTTLMRKRDTLANVQATQIAAAERNDLVHGLVLQNTIARLDGEIDATAFAVAAIQTRTRVGMEGVDKRVARN